MTGSYDQFIIPEIKDQRVIGTLEEPLLNIADRKIAGMRNILATNTTGKYPVKIT